MTSDALHSYTALLTGGLIAFSLSGIVTIQVLIYFKLFPMDILSRKLMVAFIWLLDLVHSAFILCSLYDFFIAHFGEWDRIDHIPCTVALSVVVTAVQTLIAHFFFIFRIFRASRNNYWIATPIAVLVIFRLAAACASATEMIQVQQFSAFIRPFPGWLFTLGLSLSAACDILITSWMCFFLHRMKERINSYSASKVVDHLILYTLENGALTCVVTVVSLVCWLTMPTNVIFLGLHFVIGKLYANSLLASLNTRKVWNRAATGPRHAPPMTTKTRKNDITTFNTNTVTLPYPVLTTSESMLSASHYGTSQSEMQFAGRGRDREKDLESSVDPFAQNRHWGNSSETSSPPSTPPPEPLSPRKMEIAVSRTTERRSDRNSMLARTTTTTAFPEMTLTMKKKGIWPSRERAPHVSWVRDG